MREALRKLVGSQRRLDALELARQALEEQNMTYQVVGAIDATNAQFEIDFDEAVRESVVRALGG